MRIIVNILFAASILSANSLTVKDGDVIASINNVEKSLKNGNELAIDYGSTVCFKSGKGRLLIDEDIQLKKPNKCYLIPVPEGFDIKNYFAKAKETITIAMIDSSENVKHGVSTKGTNDLDDGKDIVLRNNSEDLVIYSKEFGPHPITINLKDEKGNILMSVENEETDVTFFKVANSSIKSGYKVEVLDGFEAPILIKKIVKE
jgi:hypothetical protein